MCLLSILLLFQSCGEYILKKNVTAEQNKDAFIFNPFEFGDEFFTKESIKEPVNEKNTTIQPKRPPNKFKRKGVI